MIEGDHIYTHDGQKLNYMQHRYIEEFLIHGDRKKAATLAGYASTGSVANNPAVQKEIEYRLKTMEDEKTATAKEIFEFWTAMMRGQVEDQFGLETTNSDKLKASQELAKRLIDTKGKGGSDNALTIKLDWSGVGDE